MRIPLELIAKAEHEQYEQRLDADEIRKLRKRNATELAHSLDTPEVVERRRRMLAAVAPENIADAFERYIGKNDLLPVNYLLTGYLQSRSVGLIRYFDKREGKGAVATGFLISEDLLMTNHHVFPVSTPAEFANFARDATVDFNAEYDIDGNHRDQLCFELDPDRFLHTSKDLDMALIAVRPTDKTGTKALKSQGFLVLNPTLGKIGKGDFASIIQHPSGKEKQIAIRKNEIVDIEHPTALTYVSDTAQGSSGAPVFNDQWQAIALHSAGVPKKNARGEYIDEDDQVIDTVDGRIDEDRIVWESNRGTRVSAMMNYLKQAPGVAAHPLVQALFSPAYTDSRPYAFLSRPTFDGERTTAVVPPSPVVPAVAAFAGFPPVNISIAIGPAGPVVSTTGAVLPPLHDVVDLEKKFEDEMDFSGCLGFDENFMGVFIPMPVPNTALRQKLAFLTANPQAFLLKYHHFSTIHHAVRRVPVVSGINVHAKHRFAALDEEGARVDRWYRDNRIDYDVQLNDEFYKKSGFDKGHMTRREDAEWGTSVSKAKLAADMTCSYANAAPQVPALNRNRFGFHGRWGQLEMELLEKGIENESGKAARICVFNGPLFDDDDRPFKGVQVALRFYKVVVWYDGDAKLRTTCYELSQAKLVGDIEFEVLRFDDVFKTSQVPIGKIEKATGLTFHDNIVNNDTSSGGEDPIE